MAWEVLYYETTSGKTPIEEFLEALPIKAAARCATYISLLEQRGRDLPRSHIAPIEGDLWELRPEFAGVEYRFFFFPLDPIRFVIVHAIVKKTRKLKSRDIRIARDRMLEVRGRKPGEK